MERKEWTLAADDAGRRLDRILRRLLKASSQGAIESAVRKGLVKLNGKKSAASDLTKKGDILSVASFLLLPDFAKSQSESNSRDQESGSQIQKRIPWPIVFKNKSLLVIDKPAGVATHGQGSVAQFFAGQKTDGLAFVQAPLHRLDKGTSGLLAVSQSMEGAAWFCQKIKSREIKKFYWGIVQGSLDGERLWEDKLFIDGRFLEAKTIARPLREGLFNGHEICLVEYQIFTGRKRQIRAQSAARGLPILGDKKFGGGILGLDKNRFFLRAVRIEFPQNELEIPCAIEAPESQEFLAFFKD